MRAANPESLSSSEVVKPVSVTTATTAPAQEQSSWENVGKNHLPPRGDITDLVNKEVPPITNQEEEEERRGDGKSERLSNGFSDHKTKHNDEEEEDMEVGGASQERGVASQERDVASQERDVASQERGVASQERGVAVNGERREEEGGERNSQSEDELRQSVGSVTSNEFNPNVFGGVREEEMAEGGRWPAGAGESSAPAAGDDTVHQV